MIFRKGDKIRIKPYCKIDDNNTGLYFLPAMTSYCGMILTLAGQTVTPKIWRLEDVEWAWHENWFEQTTFLSDELFEI